MMAIILNFILLGVVAFIIFEEGLPNDEGWLYVIPMILAPLFSLIALFGAKGDNWFALYLKRKALEERKRIEELKESNSPESLDSDN